MEVTSTTPFTRKYHTPEELNEKFVFAREQPKPVEDPSKYDISTFVRLDNSLEARKSKAKPLFSEPALYRNTPVYETYQQIQSTAESAINAFFDGTMSEQELSDTYQDSIKKFIMACDEYDYPNIFHLDDVEEQVAAESLYSEFRRKILEIAVSRNNAIGKQYITGEMNAQRNWKYYNSDFYYKSEAAIAAITDGVMAFAKEREYEEFTLPDYQADGKWLYYNFNSALSNPMNVEEKFFSDVSKIPPKDFEWFYQSGGDSINKVGVATLVEEIIRPDGTSEYVAEANKKKLFDPTDSETATTWASYRDADGNRHFISQDFNYSGKKDDFYKVFDLLKFNTGNKEADMKVNSFLQNLNVYPQGYFSRFPSKPVNLLT